MSSIKVISRPHGWGLFTINRSSNTLTKEMKIYTVNKRDRDWYDVHYAVKLQTSTLFHKTIGYNRLARKIAIANLGGPVKRKINWKEKEGKLQF